MTSARQGEFSPRVTIFIKGYALWIPVSIAAILLLAVGRIYLPSSAQKRFDSSDWQHDGDPESDRVPRRAMIKDLVTNVLPGRTRPQMVDLLGWSPTRAEAQAAAPEVDGGETWEERRARLAAAGLDPENHYVDDYLEYDWDLAYPIGKRSTSAILRILSVLDPNIGEYDPDYLFIRLGKDGTFESWYSFGFGDTPWKEIVGHSGNKTYREKR